ncbi:N-terminal domain of peptidoglycan hydrolase CwlO-containing protein [Lentibacillus halodurans]|uniref:N-terminal domain of peptidoglycan hydrolase CwlO-containing protein n=1 Tax=Lentibacillus halodurans TaxID=237679 RepID=A0A1I0WNL5_9BACI|nr:C40 family peptidase [Lentibacillus halodurans]SFA90134.1 N-terminal domain of peptidoglycan hydrolase CwlO-containing protein [Lentibacillus halodurans]
MKKTIGTAVTAGAVLVGSVFLSGSVHAERLQDVQDERSEVQSDLSDAEAEIADVMEEKEELNEKIESFTKALDKNEQKMEETEEQITETEEKAAEIEEEVTALEEKIEERKAILKERLVSLQKQGGDINYMEVIFGSKSFGDMISRVSAVSKIAESDEKLLKQQEEDKAELQEKKDAKKEKLSDLKDMKTELEGMEETITAQKEEVESDKQKLKEKEQELKDMKAELEDEDSSLAAIEREISQSSDNSDAVGSASSSSGDGGELKQLSKSGGSFSSAIEAGFTQTGTPYVTAGKSPGGFDCSGFVSWAFGQAGISIPSSTAALQSVGTKVSYSNAQPGDLVFFNTYKTNGHVGIYLGNGEFLGAQSSTGVAVADMNSKYWSSNFSGHVRRIQ